MKVAIFTDTFVPQINGVAKTLTKLIDYFEENEIEYRVFAPAFKRHETDKNIIRFSSMKFFIYPECRLSFPNYPFVKKEMDVFKPDIIHVVTEFNLGLCGLRYAKTHKIPVVSSFETNIPQYLKYYHLRFLEKRAWSFFKWFHSKCDMNFCPSKATTNLLKTKGLKNVDVWERGIELGNYSPQYRNDELRKSLKINDKIVFLYVGRVSPEKNLDLFLNVADKLNEKYKKKIHFIIVGGGPSLKKLENMAPSNVTFTGFVKGNKLSEIYASSDVFLFPSATETLGFVILEAMASGLPAICCGEGGITDNVKDGYNGIICREKSVEDYYSAAEKLIKDKQLRKTMSDNAIKHVTKKDWNNSISNLINSYSNVIVNKCSLEIDDDMVKSERIL